MNDNTNNNEVIENGTNLNSNNINDVNTNNQVIQNNQMNSVNADNQVIQDNQMSNVNADNQVMQNNQMNKVNADNQVMQNNQMNSVNADNQVMQNNQMNNVNADNQVMQNNQMNSVNVDNQVMQNNQMNNVNADNQVMQNNQMNNVNVDNNLVTNSNNKPNKNKIIIVLILLVLILFALGTFVFKLLINYNNPKTRFLVSMSKYLNNSNIKEEAKSVYEMFDNGVTINMDGTVKLNYAETDMINGSYKFNLIDSPNNSEQYYNLKLNNEDEELINLEGLVKNNKIYATVKNTFEKYYFTDFDYVKLYSKDQEKFNNNITSTINSYFTEDKFTTSDETINIDSKDVKVKKVSIKITEKNILELLNKILVNLKNDDEALKVILTKDVTLESIKSDIDNLIDSVNEALPNASQDEALVYSSYLKSFNLIKQEFSFDDYIFTITGEKSGQIAISYNNEKIVSGTYDENNINLVYSKDNTNVKFDINYKDNMEKEKINSNYKVNITMNNTEDKATLNTAFNLEMTLNLEMNNNNTIPNIDISNSDEISNISQSDSSALTEKIMNFPIIKDYYNALSNANSYSNMPSTDFNVEMDDCDYAFNCQPDNNGTYSCKYYNDDFEEEDITCEENTENNF